MVRAASSDHQHQQEPEAVPQLSRRHLLVGSAASAAAASVTGTPAAQARAPSGALPATLQRNSSYNTYTDITTRLA